MKNIIFYFSGAIFNRYIFHYHATISIILSINIFILFIYLIFIRLYIKHLYGSFYY